MTPSRPKPVSKRQANSDHCADPATTTELTAIATDRIVSLRSKYVSLIHEEPPKAFGPDLLRHRIAHRIQANVFGDLPRDMRRLLDLAIKASSATTTGALRIPRRIPPGSELVRDWKGKTYRVVVMRDGFACGGKTYHSLSQIVSHITGTNWNGPNFFGLRSKSREIVNGK